MSSKKRDISVTCRIKFSPKENAMLKHLIDTYGAKNWILIASMMPGRNPKQCRDRFCNYLSKFRQVGPWTKEEDQLLLSLLDKFGSKWVKISHIIPNRSENDVKNRWYKHLKNNHPDLNEHILSMSSKNKKKDELINVDSEQIDEIVKDGNQISEIFKNPLSKYSIEALLV